MVRKTQLLEGSIEAQLRDRRFDHTHAFRYAWVGNPLDHCPLENAYERAGVLMAAA
jgi:hypothetical protein